MAKQKINWFHTIPKALDKKSADFFIRLIKFYQATVSPDHGAIKDENPLHGCKFYPSCSEYGIQSLKKYGFLEGGIKTAWRILRCHPWSKGGVDKP